MLYEICFIETYLKPTGENLLMFYNIASNSTQNNKLEQLKEKSSMILIEAVDDPSITASAF